MVPTSSAYLKEVTLAHLQHQAYMENTCPLITNADTKYDNFNANAYSRGTLVSFSLQPRMAGVDSLVAAWGTAEQRFATLNVNQQWNTSYAFTSDQFVTQAKDYLGDWAKTAALTMGTALEKAQGQRLLEGTTRFYGDGVTAINSFEQLATITSFQTYYGVVSGMKGIVPQYSVPATIATGLSKFTPDLNDKNVLSWKLGEYSRTKWYSSTLLQQQIAGSVGTNATELTVTDVTRGTDGGITAITCSGATPSVAAFNPNDLIYFTTGEKLCQFIGGAPTPIAMQAAVPELAMASSGGVVTFKVNPTIYDPQSVIINADAKRLLNCSQTITAGSKIKGITSHIGGVIYGMSGNLFATLRLPDKHPFTTANEVDPVSGIGFRKAWGAQLENGNVGFVDDIQYNGLFIPDVAMRICYPIPTSAQIM